MIGSNCPLPLQAQSGTWAPHVAPPSFEIESAIHGSGPLPLQGLPTPYRVVTTWTYGALGSAATAGSQSSALLLTTYSPAQPDAGAVVIVDASTARVPARRAS